MRVAVIGAGIVGVTTAHALARDGHEVTVFERRGSVAEEASFAHGGLVSPGLIAPWSLPSLHAKAWTSLLARPWAPGQLRWLWQRWRAGSAPIWQANRARLHRLARYSQQAQQQLAQDLQLAYEQRPGALLLLRTPKALTQARDGLKLLAELGASFHLVDAARARQIEPGLNPDTALHAAVHLAEDEVGNCRQFAHLLKAEAQRLGAQFRFQRSVVGMTAGAQPKLRHAPAADQAVPAGAPQEDSFDAVVLCAALGSPPLLRTLGIRLPMAPVHGYSVSAPLRHVEGHPEFGPRSAVVDGQHQVTISRLGQRVRVTGGAELGGSLGQMRPAAIAQLYAVLNDWYPGCAQLAQAQRWKGARPMLPDGPPVLGASGAPGIWLNLGHGDSGWTLACGSARVLADQVAGRAPALDVDGLDMGRLRRPWSARAAAR